MYSTQLQSIKNTVNTYKVSSSQKWRGSAPQPVGGSLQHCILRGDTNAASLKMSAPMGLRDNACNLRHWSHSTLCLPQVLVKVKNCCLRGLAQEKPQKTSVWVMFFDMSLCPNPLTQNSWAPYHRLLKANSQYQQVPRASTQNSCSPRLLGPWVLTFGAWAFGSPPSLPSFLYLLEKWWHFSIILVLLAPWVCLPACALAPFPHTVLENITTLN